MKDFILIFLYPLCTGMFGVYLGNNILSDVKEEYHNIQNECQAFLIETNAPRNQKCEVVMFYEVVEGGK